MEALYKTTLDTKYGTRSIGVYTMDITAIKDPIDILAISCYQKSYHPTQGTLIRALEDTMAINIQEESTDPEIDLRTIGDVWLTKVLNEYTPELPISRIGVVEMSLYTPERDEWQKGKDGVRNVLHTFFQMLELAAGNGVKVENIVLPVLGAGRQRIDVEFIAIPLLNECINFLKKCEYAKNIYIVERSPQKAYKIARCLEDSYQLREQQISANVQSKVTGSISNQENKKDIFLSYSSKDARYLQKLQEIFEGKGMNVWYAPRDIWGTDYASCIVNAIQETDYFVPLISKNSMASKHVLNEIDLAFNKPVSETHLMPIKLDDSVINSSFLYYLCRLQWHYAKDDTDTIFEEFAEKLLERIKHQIEK